VKNSWLTNAAIIRHQSFKVKERKGDRKESAAETADRIARAKTLLLSNTPKTTDDKVVRLFGLSWTKADSREIKRAVQQLLAEQRPTGGWGQIPELTNDAYSTGLVLVVLPSRRASSDKQSFSAWREILIAHT